MYEIEENRRHAFTLWANESEKPLLLNDFVLHDLDSSEAMKADAFLRFGSVDERLAFDFLGDIQYTYTTRWVNSSTIQLTINSPASFQVYKKVCV